MIEQPSRGDIASQCGQHILTNRVPGIYQVEHYDNGAEECDPPIRDLPYQRKHQSKAQGYAHIEVDHGVTVIVDGC
jgi:hypothetical protein